MAQLLVKNLLLVGACYFAVTAGQQALSCDTGSTPMPGQCAPGFEPRRTGSGCYECKRTNDDCPNKIPDPLAPTGWKCCEAFEVASWSHELQRGACCPPGHDLKPSTTGAGEESACCPSDNTWDGYQCVQPHCQSQSYNAYPPARQHAHSPPAAYKHALIPPLTDQQYGQAMVGGGAPTGCNNCSKGPDENGVAPGSSGFRPGTDMQGKTTLGIEYGKCYVLYFSDGRQIGRLCEEGGAYTTDKPFFTDLPFKVCSADLDCSKSGPVRIHDAWALNDLFGHQDWNDGKKGWFSKGLDHEKVTSERKHAAVFSGWPAYLDGQYAICVHGRGSGFARACPSDVKHLSM